MNEGKKDKSMESVILGSVLSAAAFDAFISTWSDDVRS
jgi:hypothetical protein